jgi:hypothetical protein
VLGSQAAFLPGLQQLAQLQMAQLQSFGVTPDKRGSRLGGGWALAMVKEGLCCNVLQCAHAKQQCTLTISALQCVASFCLHSGVTCSHLLSQLVTDLHVQSICASACNCASGAPLCSPACLCACTAGGMLGPNTPDDVRMAHLGLQFA